MRKFAKLFAVCGLLSLCIGVVSAGAQTLKDLQACQAAFTDPDGAIPACTTFIRTRRTVDGRAAPAAALSSIEALRGFAYLVREEHNLAIADFTAALTATTPNNFSVLALRARAHIGLKEYSLALADLDLELRSVTQPKVQAEALTMRALTYYVQHKYDLALADTAKAIELDPKSGEPHFYRATLYQFMGQNEKAKTEYALAYALAMKVDASRAKLYAGYEVLDGAWADYLKDIQETNDYANWSMPPLDAYLGRDTVSASTQTENGSGAKTESTSCDLAAEHWKSAESIGTLAAFEDHLARFPNCAFATLAKVRIDAFKRGKSK